MCTIPLDTAKVRLQLQRKTTLLPVSPAAAAAATAAAAGGGTLATIMSIAREEGVAALWKGVIPGLHRQFLYGGLRIGLYEPVCNHASTLFPFSPPPIQSDIFFTTFSNLFKVTWSSSQQQMKSPFSSLAGQGFLRRRCCCG